MSVCVSVCKVLCVRVFTLSVWNVSVAVFSSVVLTINRRRRRRQRRVCTTKNVDEIHVCRSASSGSGTRSDMRGHTHALHTAHLSISRPSTGRSIEAFFHPSVRVTLSLSSRTIERARVHPYTHGNADTWAHALIRFCIMCVPEHKGACIFRIAS